MEEVAGGSAGTDAGPGAADRAIDDLAAAAGPVASGPAARSSPHEEARAEPGSQGLAEGGAAPGGPEVPAGETFTLAEVCQRLGLTPFVVRGLIEDFGDLLTVSDGEHGRLVDAVSLDRLGRIHALRSAGSGPDEVRRRLAEDASGTAPDPGERLLAELTRLQNELRSSEERRAEDRDRLLTGLMRTQQEIQHLRFELSALRSRRDRRRGLWARLFG